VEKVMKAYFNRMPAFLWVGMLVPALLIGHTLVLAVAPAVWALVPETVRAVLHLL
jgi:hypothetical protein